MDFEVALFLKHDGWLTDALRRAGQRSKTFSWVSSSEREIA